MEMDDHGLLKVWGVLWGLHRPFWLGGCGLWPCRQYHGVLWCKYHHNHARIFVIIVIIIITMWAISLSWITLMLVFHRHLNFYWQGACGISICTCIEYIWGHLTKGSCDILIFSCICICISVSFVFLYFCTEYICGQLPKGGREVDRFLCKGSWFGAKKNLRMFRK